MPVSTWPHIRVEADGIAYIKGTRTKVVEVALDRIAHHWDADEIQRQYPHLSLGQIYSALAYYYDHRAECEQLIESRRQTAMGIRRKVENVVLQARLRELSDQ